MDDIAYFPRYNIAPCLNVLTIIQDSDVRRAKYARWGLINSSLGKITEYWLYANKY